MKIALIGSRGFIATVLTKIWQDERLYLFNRSPQKGEFFFDLERLGDIDFSIFDDIDCAIFLAANSSIEQCELHSGAMYNLNVTQTKKAIEQITARDCKVIFASSDAIFGAYEGEAYEDSEGEPMSNYGQMKKIIELEFRRNTNFATVRLPYVFSCTDKFTSFYLKAIKRNEPVEIYNPFSRSIVSALDLAKIFSWLMNNWGKHYVLNAAGPQLISRVQLAEAINRILGIPRVYDIVPIPEDFTKARPAVLNMKSRYLDKIFPAMQAESVLDKVKADFSRFYHNEEI